MLILLLPAAKSGAEIIHDASADFSIANGPVAIISNAWRLGIPAQSDTVKAADNSWGF